MILVLASVTMTATCGLPSDREQPDCQDVTSSQMGTKRLVSAASSQYVAERLRRTKTISVRTAGPRTHHFPECKAGLLATPLVVEMGICRRIEQNCSCPRELDFAVSDYCSEDQPYPTGNTLLLHYRAQPVNAVYCENHTEHTDTVRTPQETHYFSTTGPNRLMLFTVRTLRNTQIQSVPHRKHITSPLQSPTG
jgi:hypothetical protein